MNYNSIFHNFLLLLRLFLKKSAIIFFWGLSNSFFYSDAWQVWWLVLSNRVHCIFQEIDSSSDLCHDIASLLGALLIKPWYIVHVHTKVKGIVVFRDLRFKYKSDLLPGVNSSVDTFLEMLLEFLLQHSGHYFYFPDFVL